MPMTVAMAVVKGRKGIDVGAVVLDALTASRMQHKEAWVTCGYPDGSQWSKAVNGQAPLDLWYMRHLPDRFGREFLPLLASALIRQFLHEEANDQKRMAKATLRAVEDERKVS